MTDRPTLTFHVSPVEGVSLSGYSDELDDVQIAGVLQLPPEVVRVALFTTAAAGEAVNPATIAVSRKDTIATRRSCAEEMAQDGYKA